MQDANSRNLRADIQVFEMPGYFRISLTATEAMIESALPAFAAAIESMPVS
jgi:hypothetical protein